MRELKPICCESLLLCKFCKLEDAWQKRLMSITNNNFPRDIGHGEDGPAARTTLVISRKSRRSKGTTFACKEMRQTRPKRKQCKARGRDWDRGRREGVKGSRSGVPTLRWYLILFVNSETHGRWCFQPRQQNPEASDLGYLKTAMDDSRTWSF